MGTRFDLYVNKGKTAEWLGSYPFDGYPSGKPSSANLLTQTTEADWRAAVERFLADHADEATLPAMGWPWPWPDSRTTDYAYTFADGRVWVSNYGSAWVPAERFAGAEQPQSVPEWETEAKEEFPEMATLPDRRWPWETEAKEEFPDMTGRQAVTLGPRSGLIVLTGRS